MADSLIIECPNCGQKNRLRDRGIFICGSCKGRLVMGGRDDLYLPGNKEPLEKLAGSLAFGLNMVSMDAGKAVSSELKLTTPDSIDFLLLGFHLLDRSLFQIYGENGRKLFTDELLREIYRHITCDMSNSKAREIGRNLIERVNSAQAEFCKYSEIFPKKSQDSIRILLDSGKGESDCLILEFAKKFFPPRCRDRSPLLLVMKTMDFYTTVQNLLRDKLAEKHL